MSKTLFAALLACMLASTATAKVFELPDEDPYSTITIPKSWKPADFDDGVEATSEDGDVYIAVETTSIKNTQDAMEKGYAYLKTKGVRINEFKKSKVEDIKLNGLKAEQITWTGILKDRDCKVGILLVHITGNKGLLWIYWASPKGDEKYSKDLFKIVFSINKLHGGGEKLAGE